MALAPHWLDDVFENVRDEEEMLSVLLNAPEMREIASKAFQAGEEQRRAYERNPKLCSAGVAQAIRVEFLRRLEAPAREEAIA